MKMHPCFWFNGKAREAADFYCKVFPYSKILSDNGMVVMFELNRQTIMALNGGPQYTFTPAVSFVITCKNQEEIDYYWSLLSEGGREDMCGWLVDRYGLSWQVVPEVLSELMNDPQRREKAIQSFLKMKKFIITDLY